MENLLINRILERIPAQFKPTNYLMGALDIGRESAYRRIRGEIPFTFKEVSDLSMKLGFSIDEVVSNSKIYRAFLDIPAGLSSGEDFFLNMLRNYYRYINSQNLEILATLNRTPLSAFMVSEPLFRFYCYKCLHQMHNEPESISFSDMKIPQEAFSIRKKYLAKIKNVNNSVYIVDKDMFLTVCREIQYFYSRKLLGDEDVIILKNALLELLDRLRSMIHSGCNSFGVENRFYLSLLEIDSNSTCFVSEKNIISLFWIYSANFIEICNTEICNTYREWFDSMKKYAILITGSNEIFQAGFIKRQRRHIEEISDGFLFMNL
ncbi:MAG: hypothetical protein LBH32_10715 [Dysgonamonadaceae bacterium]|jgi:hypothetical protein|nr:hypothetical protein [Dysgonamonadaceae bacterium]